MVKLKNKGRKLRQPMHDRARHQHFMSSIGEKVINLGRLYSCLLGGERVSSASSSSENTLSVDSAGFVELPSLGETLWPGNRTSAVLMLLKIMEPPWPCSAMVPRLVLSFSSKGMSNSSSLIKSARLSSRLSRLSQLGSVSWSSVGTTALMLLLLGLTALWSNVSHSCVLWSEWAPCWLTGASLQLVTSRGKLTGLSSIPQEDSVGVRHLITVSSKATGRPCFSALSSSRALCQEVFTSLT